MTLHPEQYRQMERPNAEPPIGGLMPRYPRRTHEDVASLPAALFWIRTAWTTLPVPPAKLHDRDIEELSQLGSHRFSAPMWRILNSQPLDEYDAVESVMCRHPQILADASAFDCPACHGEGFYDHTARRYRSPMSAALHRLSKMPSPSDGTPAPIEYVMALASTGWDLERAAPLLGLHVVSADHAATVEAMFLLAIRRLHDRYSAGPVGRVGWVDLSESQRNAVDAA